MTNFERRQLYLETLRKTHINIFKLESLYPDGTTEITFDSNYKNKYSADFIQGGTLNVNLNNGTRRTATVTLNNKRGYYDFDMNRLWHGQQFKLSAGILLPNNEEYFISQGIFYVKDPSYNYTSGNEIVELSLVDKWAMFDNTLWGNLEGIHEILINTNIFTAMQSVLSQDRGNGVLIDNVPPIFTNFYNDRKVTLADGTIIPFLNTPYTARIESGRTYADILLELNTMLASWIGYDRNGHLTVVPSQDDISDIQKPVLWDFSIDKPDFFSANYNVRNSEIYNDVIVIGANTQLKQAKGRATNTNVKSPMNIYGTLGKRTKLIESEQYTSDEQCNDLANWELKKNTFLQCGVSINCIPIYHVTENALVSLERTRYTVKGDLIYTNERHLVTGFSTPIADTGSMSLECTSANDLEAS